MTENKSLVIIGAGGHGRVVADIAGCLGYKNISFLDDDTSIRSCMDFSVIGTSKDASNFPDSDFIIAVGNADDRERLQKELLIAGLKVVTLIHPKAVVSSKAKIGTGSVVMAGAVINPGSVIGEGCIINTGATVDHDNSIDDYAHISVGSHLAGTVSVGKGTWIGAGAIVDNDVSICAGCMIGAGAVVVRDICEPGTYVGVPAKIRNKKTELFENMPG